MRFDSKKFWIGTWLAASIVWMGTIGGAFVYQEVESRLEFARDDRIEEPVGGSAQDLLHLADPEANRTVTTIRLSKPSIWNEISRYLLVAALVICPPFALLGIVLFVRMIGRRLTGGDGV